MLMDMPLGINFGVDGRRGNSCIVIVKNEGKAKGERCRMSSSNEREING